MSELNIGSEQIITVIQCNVKSYQKNSKMIKDRASMFLSLKKKIQLVTNGFYLIMGKSNIS